MEAVMIVADSETAGRFKSALCDAVTASDAADCLDKLSSIRIGLLIVSMELPGSAGLCADLRKRFDFPIITISASGEKADLLTGLSLGDDCLRHASTPSSVSRATPRRSSPTALCGSTRCQARRRFAARISA